MKILVAVKNRKCDTWAKKVHSVDLTKRGGWAIEGEFIPKVTGTFSVAGITYSALYEDDTAPPGQIYLVAYQSPPWSQGAWAALVQVTEANDTDNYEEGLYVEGGKIVFLASSRTPERVLDELRGLGVVLDAKAVGKARNPVFACALAYSRLSAPPSSLPDLPEGWEWGPEVSGVQFLRRAGHAELLFPTQPFLPPDFLRTQAKRLRALARVAETAAEMADHTQGGK